MRVARAVDCRLSHLCYEQDYGQDRSQYIVKWSVKKCLSFPHKIQSVVYRAESPQAVH